MATCMRQELIQAWDTVRFEQRADAHAPQKSEHAAAAKYKETVAAKANGYAERPARARRVHDVGSRDGRTKGKTPVKKLHVADRHGHLAVK